MKLGIVIPTLNERHKLEKLLPYLNKYSRNLSIEVVVSDAASSDDEVQTLCQTYDVTYFKNKVDQRAAQLNAGASGLDCDVYLFLHADVLPPVEFYTEIQTAIAEGSRFGMFA